MHQFAIICKHIYVWVTVNVYFSLLPYKLWSVSQVDREDFSNGSHLAEKAWRILWAEYNYACDTPLSSGRGIQMLRRTLPVLCRQCGAPWVLEKSKKMLTTRRTRPGLARQASTATPSTSLSPSLPRLEKPPSYPVSTAYHCHSGEESQRL